MEMDTVLTSFRDLCDDPIAWAVLTAVSLKALWSLVIYLRCPVCNNLPEIDPETARRLVDAKFRTSPRFLFLMLGGIVLAVGGLYALRDPAVGPFALAAILLGVFVLLVEPSKLTIDDNTLRVAAARGRSEETYALALDRLRGAHVERMAIEFAFAASLALLILVY